MGSTIKIDEAHEQAAKQDHRQNNAGGILINLARFAVDSTFNISLKGVNGSKELYKIVQERLKNAPTSHFLHHCQKPEHVKLLEGMQIKVEEMEAAFAGEKELNEGNKNSNILEPEKKKVFIRSRL